MHHSSTVNSNPAVTESIFHLNQEQHPGNVIAFAAHCHEYSQRHEVRGRIPTARAAGVCLDGRYLPYVGQVTIQLCMCSPQVADLNGYQLEYGFGEDRMLYVFEDICGTIHRTMFVSFDSQEIYAPEGRNPNGRIYRCIYISRILGK